MIAPAAFPPTHFVASPNWYSEFPVALCTADSKPCFRVSKGFDHGGGGGAASAPSATVGGPPPSSVASLVESAMVPASRLIRACPRDGVQHAIDAAPCTLAPAAPKYDSYVMIGRTMWHKRVTLPCTMELVGLLKFSCLA